VALCGVGSLPLGSGNSRPPLIQDYSLAHTIPLEGTPNGGRPRLVTLIELLDVSEKEGSMATIKFTLSTGSAVYKNDVDEGEVQHFIKGDRVTWYQGDWYSLRKGRG
jgi:hypothetical protein